MVLQQIIDVIRVKHGAFSLFLGISGGKTSALPRTGAACKRKASDVAGPHSCGLVQ